MLPTSPGAPALPGAPVKPCGPVEPVGPKKDPSCGMILAPGGSPERTVPEYVNVSRGHIVGTSHVNPGEGGMIT